MSSIYFYYIKYHYVHIQTLLENDEQTRMHLSHCRYGIIKQIQRRKYNTVHLGTSNIMLCSCRQTISLLLRSTTSNLILDLMSKLSEKVLAHKEILILIFALLILHYSKLFNRTLTGYLLPVTTTLTTNA